MTAEHSGRRGIAEEQLQMAIAAGGELSKIAVALAELEIAHGNRAIAEGSTPDGDELYHHPIYEALQQRRRELRELLLDLG